MLRQSFVSGPESRTSWYADGLSFACARCGNCCSGDPGYVWVSTEECPRIAAHLGLGLPEFTKRHLRRVGSRLALLERDGGDCEFLLREVPGLTGCAMKLGDRPPAGQVWEEPRLTGCAIHPVRPVQCRTWPFWTSNLRSRKAWSSAARGCPGIDLGQHHSLAFIRAALDANGDLPL